MADCTEKDEQKWHRPSDVMKLHRMKQKQKALQARILGNSLSTNTNSRDSLRGGKDTFSDKKRKNPFVRCSESKKSKFDESPILDESTDQTLFKLLHPNEPLPKEPSLTSFNNILNEINGKNDQKEIVAIVKAKGKKRLPIDWSLKSKMRLLSTKPFPWNQKLKLSEEASGVTGFARCINSTSETTLDTSPNARFHQCCLYWQQPSLPWVTLFPRNSVRPNNGPSFATNVTVKASLQQAYSDSFRSLFQLIRTRQCPYFYVCANNFTVLFRASGLCGFMDVHAIITPTTRGFRHMLRQEEIEFTMPLKNTRVSDQGYETLDSENGTAEPENEENVAEEEEEEEEPADEQWLKSMGVNAEDIKQINYTQARIIHKSECQIDNSEQSLVLIEGMEVHSLYNFLLNCKSATASTGPLAGIPPTLLAPVAFHGASLNALRVRENKVHLDDEDFYSLEVSGPILPSTIHSLFAINRPQHSLTATFNTVNDTEPFSKLSRNQAAEEGSAVFGKENLSDCGLDEQVLKHFCAADREFVTNVECVKYISENKTFTWT